MDFLSWDDGGKKDGIAFQVDKTEYGACWQGLRVSLVSL
jgi:hypothetical protein